MAEHEPTPSFRAEPDPDFDFEVLMEHGKADLARLVQRLERERDGLAEALDDMVWQFAHHQDGGKLGTMGLSALEEAFAALGWDDPHELTPEEREAVLCDEPGCNRFSTCGWKSTSGYRRTCGEHMLRPGRKEAADG